MSIQFRLTVMNFMQFFVWGSWLISLGAYMIVTLRFTGSQVGSIYATMGVARSSCPASWESSRIAGSTRSACTASATWSARASCSGRPPSRASTRCT